MNQSIGHNISIKLNTGCIIYRSLGCFGKCVIVCERDKRTHTHGKCDKSEKGGGCWLEQLLKVAAQNFERRRDCALLFVLLHCPLLEHMLFITDLRAAVTSSKSERNA